MKASEGQIGRVFVMRLEDGDVVPDCIERFAEDKGISSGFAIMVGGAGEGRIVAGDKSQTGPVEQILVPVEDSHEVMGVGVLAPREDGKPVLHMHAALGRSDKTITGCFQHGVKTWLVGEVILYEIVGANAVRSRDKESGLTLLKIENEPNH